VYDLNMLEDSVPNSNGEGMINFRCVCEKERLCSVPNYHRYQEAEGTVTCDRDISELQATRVRLPHGGSAAVLAIADAGATGAGEL